MRTVNDWRFFCDVCGRFQVNAGSTIHDVTATCWRCVLELRDGLDPKFQDFFFWYCWTQGDLELNGN
jgi:hypothetical protein